MSDEDTLGPFETACSAMANVLIQAVSEQLYYELEGKAKDVIGTWPDQPELEDDYSRRFDVLCSAALIQAGMEMFQAVGLGLVTEGSSDD